MPLPLSLLELLRLKEDFGLIHEDLVAAREIFDSLRSRVDDATELVNRAVESHPDYQRGMNERIQHLPNQEYSDAEDFR